MTTETPRYNLWLAGIAFLIAAAIITAAPGQETPDPANPAADPAATKTDASATPAPESLPAESAQSSQPADAAQPVSPAPAAPEDKAPALLLGDKGDGNLSNFVHTIKLYDDITYPNGEQGKVINPAADPALPFSPKNTCGRCHSYPTISGGWHFNAPAKEVAPGRPGQPWVYVDSLTRTQIPISYRRWQGVYDPQAVGLTNWGFVKQFAHHSPGGFSEQPNPEKPDLEARWAISGSVDINCLMCHNPARAYDPDEYAYQIIGPENFRWAPTAACDFAAVTGSAKAMDEFYDYTMGMPPDDPKKKPPTVAYDKSRFDDKNQIFVDITRKVPAERCYFCHTNVDIDRDEQEKWRADQDVHLQAGLTCVDCHRNGVDHMISRNYEGEPTATPKEKPLVNSLTCKGCHLGVEGSPTPVAGRLGAPKPLHKGIPTVHFDRLTCTACHSGPWPTETAHQFKTSQSHALGLKGSNKLPGALPHIQGAVFAEQHDGRIGPNKLVWPAFWGRMTDSQITPIPPQEIKDIAGDILAQGQAPAQGGWRPLTKDQITKVLQKLTPANPADPKPAYLSGGMIYRLQIAADGSVTLSESESTAAKPYVWPIAHNVRPASQSLGTGGAAGCLHCHSEKSAVFAGAVKVDSPVEGQKDARVTMVSLQKSVNPTYAKYFSLSFIFRPWMKVAVFAAAAIIAAVLLLFGLKGLAAVTRAAAGQGNQK